MKNPFPTQVCPLCEKVLRYKKLSGVQVWDCPSEVSPLGRPMSHYQVEYDAQMCVQHVVVDAFSIDTYATESGLPKSRIYKTTPAEGFGAPKWRLVKEVPKIDASTEENLRKRIHTFLPFV